VNCLKKKIKSGKTFISPLILSPLWWFPHFWFFPAISIFSSSKCPWSLNSKLWGQMVNKGRALLRKRTLFPVFRLYTCKSEGWGPLSTGGTFYPLDEAVLSHSHSIHFISSIHRKWIIHFPFPPHPLDR
jgi:hypothetical protein